MGYFDLAGDPLSLAAERASICLFLRGDLAPLKETFAVAIPEKSVADISFSPHNDPGFAWGTWYAKLGTCVADAIPAGARGALYPEIYKTRGDGFRAAMWPSLAKDAPLPPAAGGAVSIDREKGTFILSTPRTSGGFAERGNVDAGTLAFELEGAAATVWASSLDGLPLQTSRHILLTHLTDVQNTNITYADDTLTTVLSWGKLPHLMRSGAAHVRLRVASGTFTVHALASDGERLRAVPATFADGVLSFTADVAVTAEATWLYEIVRLPSPSVLILR